MTKLIVGRVTTQPDGTAVITPMGEPTMHGAQVLEHQQLVAALVDAAYNFQEAGESMLALERLIEAARAL